MRNLLQEKEPSSIPIMPVPGRMKKIVCEIDEYLLVKIQNLVNGEKTSGIIKYNSVNELVRQALQSYQKGQHNPTQPRKLGNPRIPYSFRIPPTLYELYKS